MSKGEKPKRHVLITGGTGMIGAVLQKELIKQGFSVAVLSRKPHAMNAFYWNPDNDEIDPKALKGVTDIVHLAGAGIADKRWTEKRKQVLIESRSKGPQLLLKEVLRQQIALRTFVTASGIGWYGMFNGEHVSEEKDPPTQEFISQCVVEWEKAALPFQDVCRVAQLRIGLVVHPKEGAVKKMSASVKWGAGAALASGKQWIAWVHVEDVVNAFIHVLNNDLNGPYNVVASQAINNQDFMKSLARHHKRWLLPINIPAWFLRLILGEMAVLLINGNRISNKKLLESGFSLKHEQLKLD